MTQDSLNQAIAAVQQRLERLLHRATEDSGKVLKEAIAELYNNLAELQVLAEQLEAQNDELRTTRDTIEADRQRYQNLFNCASDGYLLTDVAGIIQETNPAAAELLNTEQSYLIGKPLAVFVHPKQQRKFRQILTQLKQQQQIQREELWIFHPERKIDFPAALTAVAMRDTQGKLESVSLLLRDIGDRKRLELALQTSETKLNDILNSASASIVSFRLFANRDWEYQYQSAGSELLFGYTPAEIVADKNLWISQVIPEDRDNIILPVFEKIFAGSNVTVEYRFYHKDGSIRWILSTYNSRRDEAADCWVVTAVSTDITPRKQAQDKLAKMSIALSNAVEGISFLDAQGRYVTVNQAYANILGYSPAEMIGMVWHPTVHPEDLEAMNAAYQQMITNGKAEAEARGIRKDGSLFYKQVVFVAAYENQNQLIGHYCLMKDISDRKQAEIELQKAKAAAEAANIAKSTFLANMSHELRTPLNAILGFTQMMARDTSLSSKQQEQVKIINHAGDHLLALINDILEMSKIEAGRTSFNPTSFDLINFLIPLEELFKFKAESKGLQLNFELAPDLPQHIQTDEGKLRQVLINLIGNAIKFTEKGSIHLKLNRDNKTENIIAEPGSNWEGYYPLIFEIEDTGIGINPEEISRIFEPFTQIEAEKKAIQGTGLGLAISQKFVQMMGGNIRVDSQPKKGSLFTFDVQVLPAKAKEKNPAETPNKIISLAPNQPEYRILVVDDHPESRLLLITLLGSIGFQVRSANNGQEAISIWSTWKPHLICMDMQMPVMDGIEATKEIRSREKELFNDAEKLFSKGWERNYPTLIIALTANAFDSDKDFVLAAGCDDHISKPFQQEIVLEKIGEYLQITYLCEDKHQPTAEKKQNLESDIGIDEIKTCLAKMPDEWLSNLKRNAYIGDDNIILELIEQIPPEYAVLVKRLEDLTNNFEFEKIIDLIQN